MDDLFEKMGMAVRHLTILHNVFKRKSNFSNGDKNDYDIYKSNLNSLSCNIDELKLSSQLYAPTGRQMILADLFEYILIGRGCYSLKSKEDKERFVKLILHFVNLLMCYETMTVSDKLRRKFLTKLDEGIPNLGTEEYYHELKDFPGAVGLPKEETEAPKHLNNYFDSILPKTAGGLWHELLVYVFLIRNKIGYIIPLLLSQRLMGGERNIIPPDFLIITPDKNLYGVEVGTKKEIQSGSFSLQTNIPTATVDTENSRVSDRCPICKRWIPFCDFVIDNYSNFDKMITKAELRCLIDCNKYPRESIAAGKCIYTKYSRNKVRTLAHTQHQFADGRHYHYRCVLSNVSKKLTNKIISAQDTIALKTHYPYYSGLETLIM
jgi:hypothetical protein